jgi:hypothetical protein
MQTPIKDFCQKYHLAKRESAGNNLRIQFTVGFRVLTAISGHNQPVRDLLELDNEDMECLYNKYSKRLQEEKDRQLKQIEAEYNL